MGWLEFNKIFGWDKNNNKNFSVDYMISYSNKTKYLKIFCLLTDILTYNTSIHKNLLVIYYKQLNILPIWFKAKSNTNIFINHTYHTIRISQLVVLLLKYLFFMKRKCLLNKGNVCAENFFLFFVSFKMNKKHCF